MKYSVSQQTSKRRYLYALTGFIPAMLLVITLVFANVYEADAAGQLQINIIAAPNLVVDSNVLSPSTYAPKVATLIGEFCNTGDTALTGVTGYIGDGTTPGTYPSKTDVTIDATTYNGTYSFTHLGGASDAARYMDTLNPGQCLYQYWSFEYPQTATSGASTIPAWGTSVKPDDDLFLDFTIWGTSSENLATQTHTMYFRNEISAMANKIKPNGNPAGQWFNTDTSTIYPGETITTNGVLYRIGNVNQGFDNDGDGSPDYNAWVQPFGDPAYDPSCFRLISTTGTLTVTRSAGNPDLIINFVDQLYFTGIPADNTDVRGVVYYEFMALGGACTIPITPYQEVASGHDNEKFNGDYGTGVPSLMTYEPEVDVIKTAPGTIAENTIINYSIDFINNSATATAGITLSSGGVNAGLMISDTIPADLVYVAGSATNNNTIPTGNSVTVRYFDTSTGNWTTTEPAAANVGAIQWWLDEPLAVSPTNNLGTVTYQATVPTGYISGGGDPFIENCATSHFGDAAPFSESCDTTLVNGTNSIGDYVWADVDTDGVQDAGETGINGVDVWLYWDENNDGVLDEDEKLVATTTTATNVGDGYYEFTDLPAASYIVKVDMSDVEASLPGYNHTTPKEISVLNLSGGTTGVLTVDTADFGFGPILNLTKSLTNGEYDDGTYDNLYQGQLANYTINVINTRPGGTGPGNSCQHVVWAGTASSSGNAQSRWQNTSAAIGADDSAFTYTEMANASDDIDLGGYFISAQAGNITNVQYVMYVKELLDLDSDDSMDVLITNAGTVYDSTTPAPGDFDGAFFATQTEGEVFLATIDLGTTLGWSDFDSAAANPLNVNIIGNRGGGTSGELALDAATFIITTDEICGDPEDTLNPVPVTDTYNPAELEFVSANPPVSSQTSGTLTWNNVGSLEAGEVQPIEVVFKVLASSGVVNNAAATTGAEYLDGRPANDANDDVDADVFDAHVIGDYVWFDTNGDGNQGAAADEPGLAGVVVELYFRGGNNQTVFYNGVIYNNDDLIATTTTDANGAYLFEGVLSEDYEVVVNTAASPILTSLSATTAETDSIALSADYLAADFGYNGNSIIFGSIWHDRDGDANDPTVDTTESYISGVTVYLDDGSCTIPGTCPSTTTDENGRYQFTNVPLNATYTVVVDPPGTQVAEPTGEDTKVVCGGGTCTNDNVSPAIVVGATPDAYGGYDFGYHGANIGDTLYVDWNGDGSQDAGEEGIPNVDVHLYRDVNGNGIVDAEDTRLEIDTTDGNGQYEFVDYPAGDYLVVVDTGDTDFPGSYVQTADPDATLDNQHSLTTDGVTNVDTVDFGYQPQGTGSIGDTVWYDIDGDGQYGARESGVENVAVTLYQDQDGDGVVDLGDAVVATATTDANGEYLFDNLAGDNYIVRVDDPNFNAGQPLAGMTHTNPQTGIQNNLHRVALADGQNYEAADFGFTNSSIGDFVWQDNNGDGLNDSGEPGIPGVLVNLYLDADNDGSPDNGTPTATETTDENGLYLFDGLPPNNYLVEIDSSNFNAGGALENFTLTGDPNSYNTVDPADLSCLSPGAQECDGMHRLRGITAPDSTFFPGLQLGQNDMSADFGYQPQGVVGDTLWVDANDNGAQDAGEAGLGGIDVWLCTATPCNASTSGVISTTTDSTGYYSFGGLLDSTTYYVSVDESDLPSNLTQTFDAVGGISCTDRAVGVAPGAGDCLPEMLVVTNFSRAAGDGGIDSIGGNACAVGTNCEMDVDFGYRFIGTNLINGTVWYDTDSDQNIDGNEPIRYENVTIYLWDCGADNICGNVDDMQVGSTLTASNGTFSFPDLANGRYRVSMDVNSPSLNGLTTTTPTVYNNIDLTGGTTETRNFGVVGVLDLGDLPTSYGVTAFAENGARHTISSRLMLGANVDADPIGQAEAEAGATVLGDDQDDDFVSSGIDDEDGIVIQPGAANPSHGGWTEGTVASGNGGSMEITISSDSNWTGVPQLYMDFNESGSLLEVPLLDVNGDLISMPLPVGTYRVYFDVPVGTFPGGIENNPIFFRVRLSQTGGLAATGDGGIGEVEDYRWEFGPTAVTLQTFTATDNNVVGLIVVVVGLILAAGSFLAIRRRKVTDSLN